MPIYSTSPYFIKHSGAILPFLLFITLFIFSCQPAEKPAEKAEPEPPKKTKSVAPLPATAPEHKDYKGPTTYEIMFRTGCDENAGTKAKIYMTIVGTKGKSKETYMNQLDKQNFVSCSADVFKIPVEENYGAIEKLLIRHDNAGENPNWLVEIIRVTDVKSGIRYDFPCGKWLDKAVGDEKISREFPVARECK